jgi:hypothetical protein
MPTPETVVDNILRHIGATVYLLVLIGVIVFLIHETVMRIKWNIEEKKYVQNCKSQKASKANQNLHIPK